jgi:hypothetical protein
MGKKSLGMKKGVATKKEKGPELGGPPLIGLELL